MGSNCACVKQKMRSIIQIALVLFGLYVVQCRGIITHLKEVLGNWKGTINKWKLKMYQLIQ